ncbi:MAG: YebC/PmpR family DNA-binding transcriptional regulator [Phycisphaerae bacterium]|nr:YebC/PmpR family DNA-binding transcriptional regulator [Phycisphaerae bacterium]
MAGHSKWANIKHKKGANDKRRGKLWSKLSRNIIVAAKTGGGDPASNLALRYAIDKAKEANMPNDTIDKAVKKGTGELGAEQYQSATYEGYGPGGVAIIVDALTDNPARTAPEMKKTFERGGGNLGQPNCVSWNFLTKGVFTVNAADTSEDCLMEVVLDAGGEDVVLDEDVFEVTCDVTAYDAVGKALKAAKIETRSAEITKIPGTRVTVDADTADRVLKMIEAFEDNDDVQQVYHNLELTDELMARIGG